MPQKSSLQERYEKRVNVTMLKAKLSTIDEGMRSSFDERDSLILEAFDKKQIAAAVDIVKKLKAINFGPITSLAQARDAAVGDVTKVISGQDTRGLVRRVIDMFKDDKENPLVDSLAFADAVNNFFSQFTQYVAALGGEAGDDQTLGTIITGLGEEELADATSINGLGAEAKKKLSDLQRVIVNGMKPEGNIAKAGKNWVDKYMKGRKGLQQLAKDMLKVKLGDVKSIASSVTTSLKNVEAVSQAAAGASQQATAQTTGSTGTNSSTSSQASTGTSSTKSGAVAPKAQVPTPSTGNAAGRAFASLKDAGVDKQHGVSPATLQAIIAALDDRDHLK